MRQVRPGGRRTSPVRGPPSPLPARTPVSDRRNKSRIRLRKDLRLYWSIIRCRRPIFNKTVVARAPGCTVPGFWPDDAELCNSCRHGDTPRLYALSIIVLLQSAIHHTDTRTHIYSPLAGRTTIEMCGIAISKCRFP